MKLPSNAKTFTEFSAKDVIRQTRQTLPGAFVYRGGGEIAKFAVFRDKSRNRRFAATNREIVSYPR